ncbi:MAG: hypothetical protein HY841_01810 [Bacteroidetes bacterium]|nr:hypothetical protein [Bacteroidota bacterium]
MKKLFSENLTVQLVFLSLIVFLSRIPFLSAGFGAEEDSWLLAITAKNIAESGIYEMSRAPGHPLQEIIYSWMYSNGLFAFASNLISAIASVIASVFFALSLRNLGFRHYLFASFAFAFAPVVFISSTYTIDYMLAMAIVMMSFYFLLHEKLLVAGILLGIAVGFRITSGIMLIPFCILLFPISKNIKGIFILGLSSVFIGLLIYLPVIKTYGFSFFTFSDQFPYPNFFKVFYKATIGVFGLIGLTTIVFFKLKILFERIKSKESFIPAELSKKLFYASCIAIVLCIISYLRLPQKSAYLIPMIPFVILLFGHFLSSDAFKVFCVLLTMSSFLFSINLTDSLRGSEYSPLAMKFTMTGQEIFIDPITGPVYSDYSKRLNKIIFTEKIFKKTRIEQKKIILICGWWYNELLVRNWDCEKNQNVILVFYINKATMEKYISDGYEIYFLPEQNLYNDQYFQMNGTVAAAKPYLVNSQK